MQVVTGALGYTGRHIAERILEGGETVVTLTGRPWLPDPFGGRFGDRFRVRASCFGDEDALVRELEGADVLYNTLWIRFPAAGFTFERTVEDSGRLFRAARRAGVRRIVHVSVSNPREDSPLPYFAGKARVERLLSESGISFAVVRPTLIFGNGPEEALLLNNIAWFLRRFPVFGLPGSGDYPVQPVDIRDVVDLCVAEGARDESRVFDAVGPETMSFRDLVLRLRRAVGSRALLMGMPRSVVAASCAAIAPFLGDTVLTPEEIDGLAEGLLVSTAPPTGRRPFDPWLATVKDAIGRNYISDRQRHMAGRQPR